MDDIRLRELILKYRPRIERYEIDINDVHIQDLNQPKFLYYENNDYYDEVNDNV